METSLKSYISTDIPPFAEALQKRIFEESSIQIDVAKLTQYISDYEALTEQSRLELSKTRPDFESIKSQFMAHLRQKDSWRDLIQAGVGETLLEFVAAIGDYGQTSILRAYQETTFDARLTSSVYTLTRSLGVHIERKQPASVPVYLYGDEPSSLGDYAIPSLSQFEVGGVPFFNRETIIFNNNTIENPLEVTLYQGSVRIETFLSSGTPYQSVEIGENDYRVSDKDVYCYLDETEKYKGITDGLWHYTKSDKIFYSNTTPQGNVEILFGNSVNGKIPEIDKIICFIYVLTDGAAANSTQVNQTVSLVDINTSVPDKIRNSNADVVDATIAALRANVIGTTTGPVFNGEDERDKEFYAALAPSIRASGNRAVTRPDHYALGLSFPNIADVYFQGQKELGRYDRNLINVVGVTVLTKNGLPFTDAEWEAYTDYLETIEIHRVNYLRIDPDPVVINVAGDVYCTRDSNKTNVGSFLNYQLVDFFKLQRGSLGKSIYSNDIQDILKFNYNDMHVDYAINVFPQIDYVLTRTQYPVLGTVDISVNYSDRSYRSVPPRIL